MKRKIAYIIAILFLTTATSCSRSLPPPPGPQEPVKIDEVRGYNPNAEVVEISIDRERFIASLREPQNLARIRLIKVFSHQSAAVGGTPEYRVFDILPDSPYAMLGLRVGDVLVAVQGWVLIDPDRFPPYVQMLQFENSTELEIRRENEPLLLRVNIAPPR